MTALHEIQRQARMITHQDAHTAEDFEDQNEANAPSVEDVPEVVPDVVPVVASGPIPESSLEESYLDESDQKDERFVAAVVIEFMFRRLDYDRVAMSCAVWVGMTQQIQ